MADLPTNLKDDILDSSVNIKRKYRMIENGDGTYSFEDATEYSQVGDEYGAGLINETNKQVNARVEKAVVVRDLDTIGAITQEGFIPDALALKDVNDSLGGVQFGIDGEGNRCYLGADGSLVPFKSGFVFFGGMFHKMYVNSGSSDYTYSFYDKIYNENIVSFSSNVITFLKSGKHKLTFMKGQINTSFNVRVVINGTTVQTFTYSNSEAVSEYEFSVNQGDTLVLKIDHSDTTTGWYDSAVLIE